MASLVYYNCIDEKIIVSGQTFPHKDRIKALGARFDYPNKTWILSNSPEILEKIKSLCESLGGGAKDEPSRVTPASAPISTSTEPVELKAQTSSEGGIGPSFSVIEVMDRARLAVSEAFPRAVWVVGEIQNLNPRKGAFFFSLAEEKGQGSSGTVTISATLWSNSLDMIRRRHGKDVLDQVLSEGLKGRFLCQVNFYRDRGNVSLNVMDLDPNFTKGALALAREMLLKELRQKGLATKNKSLSMTDFPLRLGLVSADNSRAKSDFLDQLKSYNYPGEVLFRNSQMQGEQVLTTVTSAIAELVAEACDVIVITRGGGSASDLRWFDSKEVAEAVFSCPIPIVCAIGHQDDVCVAEEISYRREKTPTAAADFIIHTISQTRERLQKLSLIMSRNLGQKIETTQAYQRALLERLGRHADASLARASEGLSNFSLNLEHGARSRLKDQEARLGHYSRDLGAQALRKSDSLAAELSRSSQYLAREAVAVLARREHEAIQLKRSLQHSSQQTLASFVQRLIELRGGLQAKDPKPWLEKGYTRLFAKGRLLKKQAELKKGSLVEARLLDCILHLEVKSIEKRMKT